jgi:hypothetical protein
MSEALLDLSPPTDSAQAFQETGPNLTQISSQGRQMQIIFEALPQLVSTEKFLMPYVLGVKSVPITKRCSSGPMSAAE